MRFIKKKLTKFLEIFLGSALEKLNCANYISTKYLYEKKTKKFRPKFHRNIFLFVNGDKIRSAEFFEFENFVFYEEIIPSMSKKL